MPNALAHETSPYLLQHRDNPVAWRPWGPPALDEAREADKPILLSVGYAACHWCHVMAHESFEDDATARLMNEHFVNIKVDREERPDLDAVYQNALALMGEPGGWPLTMFLRPDGTPFWGGTYFPPAPRYGRPAFAEVLRAVAETWRREPDKIRHNAQLLAQALQGLSRPAAAGADATAVVIDRPFLDHAAERLLGLIDPVHGGVRGAPKFPQTSLLEFLWRAHLRQGRADFAQAVTRSLDRMCHGGIYDHVGGGFARYATDEAWVVPHFEKMLYDNALLVDLLTLAWRGTRSELYRRRVDETIDWLLREMTVEDGAFASSIDADSEGEEGRFYTWTVGEIERALGPDLTPDFRRAFDTPPEGHVDGRIVLHRNKPQAAAGERLEAELDACLARLRAARARRPRPTRDDKVLADWNGLMIAALAEAAFAFDRPDWLDAARRAFAAVRGRLAIGERLGHSWRAGRAQRHGLLDDYAAMSRAALALFEATGDAAYRDAAQGWVAVANAHHWDDADGGWFMSADDADDLVARPKTALDAATPSGNALMVQVLARLHLLTGDEAYARRAEAALAAFAPLASEGFVHMTALLNAAEFLAEGTQVVVAGDGDGRRPFLRAIAARSLPNVVRLPTDGDGGLLPATHPAAGKGPVGGKAAAYVCRQQTCRPPVTDPEALRRHLSPR